MQDHQIHIVQTQQILSLEIFAQEIKPVTMEVADQIVHIIHISNVQATIYTGMILAGINRTVNIVLVDVTTIPANI